MSFNQTQSSKGATVGNPNTEGNKKSNYSYQSKVLQILGLINASISAIPGIDYETRTTTYQATANGPGYSTNDIIVRYDIIDVATSTVLSTVWFNQNTQTTIVAPAPGNLTPYSPPGSVTVTNPFNLEATQLLVLAALNSIDGGIPTALGQALMAASMPVTIASDQSAIPVTLPSTSRVPSVVNVPASTVGSTTAGVKGLSILVVGGGNTVGGTSIPSGTILNWRADQNDTIAAIPYTTGAGANRLVITYLT